MEIAKILASVFGYDAFVAYSTKDGEEYARALAEFLTKNDRRVFVDWTEVEGGDRLTSHIKRAIASSGVLFAVGSVAAVDPNGWVAREVGAALHAGIRVSPIDIGGAVSGSPWPGTEDLRRLADSRDHLTKGDPSPEVLGQALRLLTRERRNSRRRRVVAGAAAIVILALAAAATFAGDALVARSNRERDAIRAELREDGLRSGTAVDRGRAAHLRSILGRANRAEFAEGIGEASERLARFPPANSVRRIPEALRAVGVAWLPGNPDLAILTHSEVLFVNSKEAKVVSRQELAVSERAKMTGKAIAFDQQRHHLHVLVEYETFAFEEKAESEGGQVQGHPKRVNGLLSHGEQEVLAFTGGRLEPEAMLEELEWKTGHDFGGEDRGPDWYEHIGGPAEFPFHSVEARRLPKTDGTTQVLSFSGKQAVYELSVPYEGREEYGFGDARQISPWAVWGDGESARLLESTSYATNGAYFFHLEQGFLFTDVLPQYAPVAIHGRNKVAFVGGHRVRFGEKGSVATRIEINTSQIERIVFADDDTAACFLLKDGSWAYLPESSSTIVNRMPVAPNSIASEVSPATCNHVAVIAADGIVDLWSLRVFGPGPLGWREPG